MLPITCIDIPFDKRHLCWFCGEPCKDFFEYHATPHTPHPSLAVPCCSECLKLAKQHPLTSIGDCRMAVKDALMALYAKHLAIGINWTEAELAESEFSCKVFEGFKKSAWMMYQIARDRINFPGWPILLEGVDLECQQDSTQFEFDGVSYSSLPAAIHYYSKQFCLDSAFFAELLRLVGKHRFSYALRLARIHIAAAKEMKRQVLADVKAELSE
ncbi:hypothetical protein HG547_09700 [Shewanella sp. DNRA4]|uniref:Uncharacterized protein n=1 Tax=Shewanella xiamenensis TaxID=332186 RepID=A0AAE4TFE6_9GAMM|nr:MULTISPECIES: hypothetical protein [Shewanella]MDV5389921.1 hypothetical protein [Shewanella xiamenensis]NMD51907.1 hypothetical protein [Shewanella sp. DNRA4]